MDASDLGIDVVPTSTQTGARNCGGNRHRTKATGERQAIVKSIGCALNNFHYRLCGCERPLGPEDTWNVGGET
jgi:hypothetical protein